MATLKGRAQHQLYAVKKRVRIPPLSIGDATAVAFTVLRASPGALLKAAYASKGVSGSPKESEKRVFNHIIQSVVDHRKGSIYAAFVTAVDIKEVFHPDQYATSLRRLGIMDDIEAQMKANGFATSALVGAKAPFFWADHTSKEISNVRKEVTTVVQRVVSRFTEDITPEDIDALIETQLYEFDFETMAPRQVMFHGAVNMDLGPGKQSIMLNLFRKLANVSRDIKLDASSTLAGSFEAFHQHLLVDTAALQRGLPKAKFGGQSVSAMQVQKLFRDSNLVRKLKLAFDYAYDKSKHSVNVDRLYRGMRQHKVSLEIERAAKMRLHKTLSRNTVSGIMSGVVGLFFAYAGDNKGQAIPFIKAMSKG